jgi:hypothetical protein
MYPFSWHAVYIFILKLSSMLPSIIFISDEHTSKRERLYTSFEKRYILLWNSTMKRKVYTSLKNKNIILWLQTSIYYFGNKQCTLFIWIWTVCLYLNLNSMSARSIYLSIWKWAVCLCEITFLHTTNIRATIPLMFHDKKIKQYLCYQRNHMHESFLTRIRSFIFGISSLTQCMQRNR